ncbi:MAG: transcriptional regulator [Zetaproteobacteria bacterium]|nr:MAG: transcriptional regulator [Zetaproteobacteria bacterium]
MLHLGSARLAAVWAALLLLAASNRPHTGKALARAIGCHGRYLEEDLRRLVDAGLLQSKRGKYGGYRLAVGPSRVRLVDVHDCLFAEEKSEAKGGLWGAAAAQLAEQEKALRAQLAAFTLADALDAARRANVPLPEPVEDYCI